MYCMQFIPTPAKFAEHHVLSSVEHGEAGVCKQAHFEHSMASAPTQSTEASSPPFDTAAAPAASVGQSAAAARPHFIVFSMERSVPMQSPRQAVEHSMNVVSVPAASRDAGQPQSLTHPADDTATTEASVKTFNSILLFGVRGRVAEE